MSIATLKIKTHTKYKNMSVGQPQFSLNGGYRNQGWVGQTSLSRHYPRTLMKGSGGSGGTYNKVPVVQSVTSTENHNIIKSSVLNNPGMLSTQYRWIRRPQPFAVVKPDTNRHNNDSGSYTERLRKNAITTADSCQASQCNSATVGLCNAKRCATSKTGNSNLRINKRLYNITKSPINSFAKDHSGKMAGFIGGGIPKNCADVTDTQSAYLLQLDNTCTNFDEIQYNKISHKPFAGFQTTY